MAVETSIEIPRPSDSLLAVAEKIRETGLFKASIIYAPKCQLEEADLLQPPDPWVYEQIRIGRITADSGWLPGQWVILDVTQRPDYDNGQQMYPDASVFREMLASLRDQQKIIIPDEYKCIPKDSRFAISPDEIDGSSSYVTKAIANILDLKPTEIVSSLSYLSFIYFGNREHPEFGQVNTSEWFRDSFGRDHRLFGGNSGLKGLSTVSFWPPDMRHDAIGFRLQIVSDF